MIYLLYSTVLWTDIQNVYKSNICCIGPKLAHPSRKPEKYVINVYYYYYVGPEVDKNKLADIGIQNKEEL